MIINAEILSPIFFVCHQVNLILRNKLVTLYYRRRLNLNIAYQTIRLCTLYYGRRLNLNIAYQAIRLCILRSSPPCIFRY